MSDERETLPQLQDAKAAMERDRAILMGNIRERIAWSKAHVKRLQEGIAADESWLKRLENGDE